MAPEFQEQLLQAIEKLFNHNRRQAGNVYVQLILCMRKRQYITIYRMDDDDTIEQEDVDQAILRTLLRYVLNYLSYVYKFYCFCLNHCRED